MTKRISPEPAGTFIGLVLIVAAFLIPFNRSQFFGMVYFITVLVAGLFFLVFSVLRQVEEKG